MNIFNVQEKPDGKIAELWQSKVSASNLGTTDMTQGLASVFAVKDKDEIQNVKKSAYLSAIVLRSYAVPHLEGRPIFTKYTNLSLVLHPVYSLILDSNLNCVQTMKELILKVRLQS